MSAGRQDGPAPEGGQATLLLNDLEEGATSFEFSVSAEALGLEDGYFSFASPITASVEVQRILESYSINGDVRWRVSGECCRCLAPVTEDLEATFQVLLQRKEASDDELEALDDQDDVEIVDPGTRKVDLAGRIQDLVVLELPLRAYCRQDCKGLCPQCGHELNSGPCECQSDAVDPRWEALAKLKNA